jgi:hypothetical protein
MDGRGRRGKDGWGMRGTGKGECRNGRYGQGTDEREREDRERGEGDSLY